MFKNANTITVSGTIINLNAKKYGTTIQIVTDGSGKKAYPRIFFRRNDIVFRAGDRVLIKAHIENHVIRKEGTKARFIQDCIGDSIEKAPRALLSYFDKNIIKEENGGVSPDENHAEFVGVVTNVFCSSENVTLVDIKTKGTEHSNICILTCFQRQAKYAANLKPGDTVAATGFIQTKTDTAENGYAHLQCVSVRDIEEIHVD